LHWLGRRWSGADQMLTKDEHRAVGQETVTEEGSK